MPYYKLRHTGGDLLLNTDKLVSISPNGTTQLLYKSDENQSGQLITFISEDERNDILKKLEKLLLTHNLNTLPPQT